MSAPPEEHDTRVRPEELDPERGRAIATPWGEYALFLVEGAVHCVQAFCPHLAGPLFQGTRCGDAITCPWHHWSYSVRSGARLDELEPGSSRAPLSRCEVRVGERGTLIVTRPEREPRLP